MMTRKDYIELAAALARTRPNGRQITPEDEADEQENATSRAYMAQWRVTRDAIMGVLQADNERFDRIRFIRATEQ